MPLSIGIVRTQLDMELKGLSSLNLKLDFNKK